jgi:hypothetical protein
MRLSLKHLWIVVQYKSVLCLSVSDLYISEFREHDSDSKGVTGVS